MSIEQQHADVVRYSRWFAILTDSTDWESKNCGTACTNGKTVFYDPQQFEIWTRPECFFVVIHEIIHIIKKHCLIKEIDGLPIHWPTWNLSCDEVVNREALKEANRINAMAGRIVCSMPAGLILSPEHDGKTEIEIYRELIADQESDESNDQDSDESDDEQESDENGESGPDDTQNDESGAPQDDCGPNYGIGGIIPPPESDDAGDTETGQESGETESERIDRLVEQSAQVAQMAGSLGGALAKIATENRKPKTDLRRELSRHVSRQYRADRSFRSFDRHYRRIGIPFPAKQESTDSLAVYLDCSYSIGIDELNQQIEEVNHLLITCKPARVDLFGFHVRVFPIQTIQRGASLQPIEEIEQGGTKFDAVIDHFADDENRLAIVFSDGWDCTSLDSTKPIIWIIQEGGNQNNNLPGNVITL